MKVIVLTKCNFFCIFQIFCEKEQNSLGIQADKKTQKKVQKGTRAGEKRRAEPDEWNDDSGK